MKLVRKSILVVDDEPDTCANLADIFSDIGYDVEVAHEGKSALKLVEKRHFDIALLDLKMPGMSGLELYQRMKQISAGTVAMIVTAYASQATAIAALNAGAWRIIPKPVDPAALLQWVDEVVKQPVVMVVDDDRDLCASLLDLFRGQGLRTVVAHSLTEATGRLNDSRFDVALIDLRLPEGDGSQIYDLVRQANPEARAVVITGFRDETEQLVAKIMAAGADAVCYKPFDVAVLLKTITKLAGRDP